MQYEVTECNRRLSARCLARRSTETHDQRRSGELIEPARSPGASLFVGRCTSGAPIGTVFLGRATVELPVLTEAGDGIVSIFHTRWYGGRMPHNVSQFGYGAKSRQPGIDSAHSRQPLLRGPLLIGQEPTVMRAIAREPLSLKADIEIARNFYAQFV
jgi:hypothetical protein